MTEKNYKELIPNRIFIGGIDAIDELVENEDIDVIFDLRGKVNGPLPSALSVHKPLLDEPSEQDNSIKDAVKEVVNAYKDGKNVYFHCNTGNGRGGTLAAATLLELELAKTVEEAELQAQKIRPSINIRPSFKDALKRIYETE